MDKPTLAPRGRLLSTLVIFLFGLGLFYTGFLFVQQWSINRDIGKMEDQLGELGLDIAVLQEDKIEELYNAQTLKDRLEANQTEWSTVLRKLQEVTPVGVFFNSYTGSDDGGIQVNGVAGDYEGAAGTIAALNKSKDFDGVFMPSVTAGAASDGSPVVSFNLQISAVQE
jgi:hypothetical protein